MFYNIESSTRGSVSPFCSASQRAGRYFVNWATPRQAERTWRYQEGAVLERQGSKRPRLAQVKAELWAVRWASRLWPQAPAAARRKSPVDGS